MAYRRQLEQQFFEMFAGKGQALLSNRHLAQLTQESDHTVKDIFEARYDEIYLANIPNKNVFEKTLHDLENVIDACRQTKIRSKNKPAPIMQDETYLDHYLELLFTDKEKQALQGLINANFHLEPQEEDNANNTQVVAYILKGIFGISRKESNQHEPEVYEYTPYSSMDFD